MQTFQCVCVCACVCVCVCVCVLFLLLLLQIICHQIGCWDILSLNEFFQKTGTGKLAHQNGPAK